MKTLGWILLHLSLPCGWSHVWAPPAVQEICFFLTPALLVSSCFLLFGKAEHAN